MQNIMELHEAGLMSQTDHDAWLEWTSAIYRTPGASALWPQISPVLTSTISKLLQAHRDANPDAPTILEIMPVFRQSRLSGAGAGTTAAD